MKLKNLAILCFFFAQRIFGAPVVNVATGDPSVSSVLFAKAHLDDLLSLCSNDECNLSEDQKSWLRTARQLSQTAPEPVFKNQADMTGQKFQRHDNEVWLNQDLLWKDDSHTIPYRVSDAVVLWLDILLQGKMIARPELSILEFEISRAVDEKY